MPQVERSGPSIFQRREQSSQDRALMIAQNIGAWTKSAGIVPETSASISRDDHALLRVWNLLPRPVKFGAAGALLLAVACSGGAKGEEPTQTPTLFKPTPAESPINPTVTSPTATETSTVIKPPDAGKGPDPTPSATATATATPENNMPERRKLAESEYEFTTFDQVKDAFDNAFRLHPDGGNVVDQGGNQLTQQRLANNLEYCKSGSPNPPSTSTLEFDRLHNCGGLTGRALVIYRQTGYEEFFELARRTANYFSTVLPSLRPDFDKSLSVFFQDTSPAIK